MGVDYDANPDKWQFNRERHVELLFCPDRIALLNQITKATGADIVVSSSWRMFYSGPKFALLVQILRGCGVRGDFFGYTSPLFPNRWTAIDQWLEANKPASYLILDDQEPPSHLLQYAPEIWGHKGLGDHHIEACIKILNGG